LAIVQHLHPSENTTWRFRSTRMTPAMRSAGSNAASECIHYALFLHDMNILLTGIIPVAGSLLSILLVGYIRSITPGVDESDDEQTNQQDVENTSVPGATSIP